MNKRYIHHLLKQLQRFHYTYFIVALVIVGATFVISYRHNNITALKLRDKVLQVDKDNGDIEAALLELRAYTYAHMNANLSGGPGSVYPPIQLKYRYDRLVAAEKQRVEAANSHLYTEAQANCERLMPHGVSKDRVPCIQEYITSHNPAITTSVPDALYKFDFAAPVWSPDLAGWSLIALLLLSGALLLRLALEYWLRYSLRD